MPRSIVGRWIHHQSSVCGSSRCSTTVRVGRQRRRLTTSESCPLLPCLRRRSSRKLTISAHAKQHPHYGPDVHGRPDTRQPACAVAHDIRAILIDLDTVLAPAKPTVAILQHSVSTARRERDKRTGGDDVRAGRQHPVEGPHESALHVRCKHAFPGYLRARACSVSPA
ncbi:unnamed protein product [Mycena citricolor]|uniref:Uncharacterized protein n=1 Tax=Mycena citricolor TaxID=2018698 RepID=A0AAD2HQT3_9AGAR|nr:unnamed protein product [Mycena citricolor]